MGPAASQGWAAAPPCWQSLTQFGQRVRHLEVVLVEAQQPPGDEERVVAGAAGDGVGPSVEADLKGHENQNQA